MAPLLTPVRLFHEKPASPACVVLVLPLGGSVKPPSLLCCCPAGAEQPPGCGDRTVTDAADRGRGRRGCWLPAHTGQGCL